VNFSQFAEGQRSSTSSPRVVRTTANGNGGALYLHSREREHNGRTWHQLIPVVSLGAISQTECVVLRRLPGCVGRGLLTWPRGRSADRRGCDRQSGVDPEISRETRGGYSRGDVDTILRGMLATFNHIFPNQPHDINFQRVPRWTPPNVICRKIPFPG